MALYIKQTTGCWERQWPSVALVFLCLHSAVLLFNVTDHSERLCTRKELAETTESQLNILFIISGSPKTATLFTRTQLCAETDDRLITMTQQRRAFSVLSMGV